MTPKKKSKDYAKEQRAKILTSATPSKGATLWVDLAAKKSAIPQVTAAISPNKTIKLDELISLSIANNPLVTRLTTTQARYRAIA